LAFNLNPAVVTGIFTRDAFPAAIEDSVLSAIEKHLIARKNTEQFKAEREFSSKMKENIDFCEGLFEWLLDLDLKIALGAFTSNLRLNKPVITEKNGFTFTGGRNLFLIKEHGEDCVHPVEYCLGKDFRISIITGANSGGKTTLLELISQVCLMAAMGLFVPASDCTVGLLDELHVFGKNRGGSSAGAFETLLCSFSDIAICDGKKRMILADEIEAVTEPGAAARIIISLLKFYEADKNMLVSIVTHLGKDIMQNATDSMRVDGIEAKGLDKNLNLIVDRNPRIGYLATSTPELIVERLARGNDSSLYKHIFDAMKMRMLTHAITVASPLRRIPDQT